jgi:tRNA/rRNA methyltransferase
MSEPGSIPVPDRIKAPAESRPVRIILVRPKIAENIGAVARIMANTGLRDLYVVSPQVDPFCKEARKLSARAEPILTSARVVERLKDALDGMEWTVAASCRPGIFRNQAQLSPRDWAARFTEQPRPTALVFGPEDYGLTNEDILHCDATIRIPSHKDYPSLNLSQSVMVLAYELFIATQERATAGPWTAGRRDRGSATPEDSRNAPADGAMLAQLIDKFREPLARIGYLNPQDPDRLLIGLRNIFGKANLTRGDVQILMGLAQQIERFALYGNISRGEKKRSAERSDQHA